MRRAATVSDFGEDAVLVDLGIEDEVDRAARTHAAASALRARFPHADVVVGAGTVLLDGAARADVAAAIGDVAFEEAAPSSSAPGRLHTVNAAYDGPDLEAAAATLGLLPAELIALHSGRDYQVELLGFLPGFAYAGPLDARLVLARRPSPRAVVPASSIGIAGAFTGIYPFASPGGWNLLGRALDLHPFDADRDPPSLFQPGDRVRFVPSPIPAPIPAARNPAGALTDERNRGLRGLVVLSTQGGATIQDLGRQGQLARGLPPSGALDRETLVAANRAVGNCDGAAAIEVPLGSLEVEATAGAVVVSVDGAVSFTLTPGKRFVITPCERAVRYLAVRGGIDVPVVLGARATLLVAKVGGAHGRALRKQDFLRIGGDIAGDSSDRGVPDARAGDPIGIDPGPHLARFPEEALHTLLATSWTVSRLGDRTGVRLEGGCIPRDCPDLALPVPMRRGAIQVSTDGTPIVLGPDHPTTGGYPVLAVVRAAGQAALARRRPGERVRFTLGAR